MMARTKSTPDLSYWRRQQALRRTRQQRQEISTIQDEISETDSRWTTSIDAESPALRTVPSYPASFANAPAINPMNLPARDHQVASAHSYQINPSSEAPTISPGSPSQFSLQKVPTRNKQGARAMSRAARSKMPHLGVAKDLYLDNDDDDDNVLNTDMEDESDKQEDSDYEEIEGGQREESIPTKPIPRKIPARRLGEKKVKSTNAPVHKDKGAHVTHDALARIRGRLMQVQVDAKRVSAGVDSLDQQVSSIIDDAHNEAGGRSPQSMPILSNDNAENGDALDETRKIAPFPPHDRDRANEASEPESFAPLWNRNSVPAESIPAFRPVSHPFICQRAHCGDGIPCPFQQECAHCAAGQPCGRGRDNCSTELNNDHVRGGFLGPAMDISTPFGTIVKKTRPGIKDYFGRNKKESNYIDFESTRLCRKCYQNMAYQRQDEPALKWPKLKSEILHVVVDKVEQQQTERTGRPGVWKIELKKAEQERLAEYDRMKRTGKLSTQAGKTPEKGAALGQASSMSSNVGNMVATKSKAGGKKKKTKRENTEGTYEAPIEILQEMDRRFCGSRKNVLDCHAINDWCRGKLEEGTLSDLPLWENVPLWNGDPNFISGKSKGKRRGTRHNSDAAIAGTPKTSKSKRHTGQTEIVGQDRHLEDTKAPGDLTVVATSDVDNESHSDTLISPPDTLHPRVLGSYKITPKVRSGTSSIHEESPVTADSLDDGILTAYRDGSTQSPPGLKRKAQGMPPLMEEEEAPSKKTKMNSKNM